MLTSSFHLQINVQYPADACCVNALVSQRRVRVRLETPFNWVLYAFEFDSFLWFVIVNVSVTKLNPLSN